MIYGYSHYNVILVACFAFRYVLYQYISVRFYVHRYYVLVRETPPVKIAFIIAFLVSLPSIVLMVANTTLQHTILFKVLNAQVALETTDNIRAHLLGKGPGYDIDGIILG